MTTAPKAKRIVDLVVAIVAIIVLSPVFVVVAALVAIDLGRPILFRQVRPGFLMLPFTIYKFRTMRHVTDANDQILPDSSRLTRLGHVLRLTSLDELPELFNVIRGDMSLVGPRPLLTEYLPYYSAIENRRFMVRPGMTGWAQINGRNQVPWDKRLALDVWYVEHYSLELDLKILFLTPWRVLSGSGVAPDTRLAEPSLSLERLETAGTAGPAHAHHAANCDDTSLESVDSPRRMKHAS